MRIYVCIYIYVYICVCAHAHVYIYVCKIKSSNLVENVFDKDVFKPAEFIRI